MERARHFHQHVQHYGGKGDGHGRSQEGGIRAAAREFGYTQTAARRYYTVGRLVDTLENAQELRIFSGDGLLGRMEALHEVAQAPAEQRREIVAVLREQLTLDYARSPLWPRLRPKLAATFG